MGFLSRFARCWAERLFGGALALLEKTVSRRLFVGEFGWDSGVGSYLHLAKGWDQSNEEDPFVGNRFALGGDY